VESTAQTCSRLLSALEDLTGREAAALQTRDFAAAIELQDRAAPLIEHLALHGPSVANTDLRRRVGDFLRRRAETGEWLSRQLTEAKEELLRTRSSQHQVARIAPVYGSGKSGSYRQLLAKG
jgi:hypothetical protein